MKSKGGSLYEVLKSASRAPGADPGAPAPETTPVNEGAQPTLQERLAAYKAAKLAAATQAAPDVRPEAAVPTTKVSATTLVLEPDPTPLPAPARVERTAPATLTVPAPVSARVQAEPVAEAPAGPGLGERVLTVTLNTALFGGMVVVGLLFIAYAVGLHVGKSAAPVAEVPRPVLPAAAAPVAPAAQRPPAPAAAAGPTVRKEYAIHLCDLKIATAQDRLKALAFAEDADLKKALERAGHKAFERANIKVNGENRMALYVDRFGDINSEAARSALTAMKNFRFKGQTPFTSAFFEEWQAH
jgi:hypothetical protein